jgi:TRAP-type transport system small permease protein
MSRLIKLLDRGLNLVAGALIVGLLAAVTAGIVSRAVNRPFVWTDEVSGFLMVWLACCGWMIATRRGSHIRIRVFQDMLPRRSWRIVETLILLAMATLGAVIAAKSLHLIQINADVEAVTLPVPTALLYVPLLPAGVVTMLQALSELLRPRWPDQSPEKALT